MKKILLGAHMPTTGGLYKSAICGQEAGCSAIQIFTKNNRQWHAKPITASDATLFKDSIKNCNINYVNAHASYLINLASPELNTQRISVKALQLELDRCHQLGISDLVLHPGAKKDLPDESAIEQVAKNINLVLASSPHDTKILLETMAGQGSSIGSSFTQLAQIIALIKEPERVGVCLDTCHIFAAGYDFTTPIKYTQMWQEFDKIIGLSKLGLIHLNDSKKALGSKVDRHAEIKDGFIGETAFRLIMNDQRLNAIPKILETPKEELDADRRNLKFLISLLDTKNIKYIEKTNLAIYLG
jgi:deoxyribonuclease-4